MTELKALSKFSLEKKLNEKEYNRMIVLAKELGFK